MPLAKLLGSTYGVAGLKAALKLSAATSASRGRRWLRSPHADVRALARRAGTVRGGRYACLLPDTDRILLGPGPSLTLAARDARHGGADGQPSRSVMMRCWTMCASRLLRLFRAPEGSFALAVSGTGTSGMETAVANLVPTARACW